MSISADKNRRDPLRVAPCSTHCPNCGKVDFIRYEQVISGLKASTFCFCGACEHEWEIPPAPVLRQRPDRRNSALRDSLTQRLCREFRVIPGLCLTPVEASRLFGVPPDICQRLLTALVKDGVLTQRSDGRFLTGGN